MAGPEKDPPLSRSIGAFFGHIVDAIVLPLLRLPELSMPTGAVSP